MASGLMSLAYLGELGVVFNLAYIELKKTRYLDFIRDNIHITVSKFKTVSTQDPKASHPQIQILNQLEDMLSTSKAKRKVAWVKYKNYRNSINNADSEHFDFIAGPVYDFFEKERDKYISQIMLIISGLSVLLITVLGFEPFFHELPKATIIWCVIFFALLIANLFPVVCIYIGRRMRTTAKACTNSFEDFLTRDFENQIATTIGNK